VQAAGRTLGRVLSISEGTGINYPQPMPYQRTMAMESRTDVPVESGTVEQSYTVSVVFELR
jgi:uncharacterized protein YggE